MLQGKGVVAIHHTQWIDRTLLKIGPESEASYDGPKEKDVAALQRRANLRLVPASTAVPAAAAKQQNDKDNYEKRGGIHVRLPRNAAYCAAWNSGVLTTFSWSVRFQERTWRDGA